MALLVMERYLHSKWLRLLVLHMATPATTQANSRVVCYFWFSFFLSSYQRSYRMQRMQHLTKRHLTKRQAYGMSNLLNVFNFFFDL